MWDETGLILYAVDPTHYDLASGELDGEVVCRRVRAGGGSAIRLLVHSSHGYAYFPSEFAPLAPGYELGRDYVAEFVEACRRHGLQLALALSVTPNSAVAQTRPDWLQIAPTGQPHSWGTIPVMCLNTGYMEYITDLVREVVARYAPDCLVLENFVLLDGCRCSACHEQFSEVAGLPLQALDSDAEAAGRYRSWRFERTEQLAWNLGMAAKALRGSLRVVFAGCGWSPARDKATGWRPERTASWMDNLESGFAMRWYAQDLHEPDLTGAYLRALGKTGWCWLEYAPLPYALVACPPTELRLKAASVVAAGCRPCIWSLEPMPPVSDSGLEPLGRFFEQFRDHPECLEPQGSFARTAVLLSRRAFETTGRDTSETVRAWTVALSRQHILWDFVLDDDLTHGRLAHYRLLIIPGTPHLPQRDLAAIAHFARGGGSVLFVGRATAYGEHGEPLEDLAAGALLGVHLVPGPKPPLSASPGSYYLRITGTPLGRLVGQLVPADECVTVQVTSAEIIAEAFPHERKPGGPRDREGSPFPGITWRMHGAGRVVYVASPLETVIVSPFGPRFTACESLVGELVRWLGGERVRVEAPPEAAVQIYRVAGGAVVHIFARPGPTPYLHENIPEIPRVELTISRALYTSGVHALDGTDVEWDQVGHRLKIVVENVKEHRCLLVEGVLG